MTQAEPDPHPDGEEGGDATGGPTGPDPQPERDWEAEWRDLTGSLEAEPRVHLVSDTPRTGAGLGPRDYVPAEDPEDEHWVPQEPPPATGSTRTRLAWTGIVGGPVLMVLAIVTFGTAEVWFVGLSLLMFVGGCLLGLSQLPARHHDDDDDGAQV